MDVKELAQQLAQTMRDALGQLRADLDKRLDEIEARQAQWDALAALPQPVIPTVKDGKDGIDGQDGKDGEDGRDALELQVHGSIESEKSYPRGHYASHMGGLWRSYRKTDPIGIDPKSTGWELLVDGVASVEFEQVDERNLKMRSV